MYFIDLISLHIIMLIVSANILLVIGLLFCFLKYNNENFCIIHIQYAKVNRLELNLQSRNYHDTTVKYFPLT